ncbi:uncharacterized protein LOC107969937 isoform X1 [Pan troglodytes]|uniref:uncharacterized protein LOC107969937 isoform X1 n=1 Tax=Pan troglodytes TaxID=9598 RepID=UPI0007DBC538|nr:uncharacterized protein LOC107969937 isoform X2 [Pan troglodytes]XP_054530553.1 uncharacterized protein LOC107969937 isoform X2 [Pan troglodytes]
MKLEHLVVLENSWHLCEDVNGGGRVRSECRSHSLGSLQPWHRRFLRSWDEEVDQQKVGLGRQPGVQILLTLQLSGLVNIQKPSSPICKMGMSNSEAALKKGSTQHGAWSLSNQYFRTSPGPFPITAAVALTGCHLQCLKAGFDASGKAPLTGVVARSP